MVGQMIIDHYSEVDWDEGRWPNFSPEELACRHCGEFFWDPIAFTMLQEARLSVDLPLRINSAHRCALHNARVGGAPLSQHKKIAFDVSLTNLNRIEIFQALLDAGFTSFGFYFSFIHCDRRPGRRWYAKGAKEIWQTQ